MCLIEKDIHYTLIASTYTNNVRSNYVHLIQPSLPTFPSNIPLQLTHGATELLSPFSTAICLGLCA